MVKTKDFTNSKWPGMTKEEAKAHMEDFKLFMKHIEEKELCPKCGRTMTGLRAAYNSNNELDTTSLFCTNKNSGCWSGRT